MKRAQPAVPGVVPPTPRAEPWWRRVVSAALAYLPLVVMALLALATWWLVQSTPSPEGSGQPVAPRHEPDYTMQQFTVQRFAADGSMRTQIEGDVALHYPDTDTLEISNPRVRAIGPDGRVTRASARRALANGDGSEVQLIDEAHVVREATAGEAAIDFRGDFLHVFVNTERVRSHLPVRVTQGSTDVQAAGMAYDNLARVIDLNGRVRATFVEPRKTAAPRAAPAAASSSASSASAAASGALSRAPSASTPPPSTRVPRSPR